MGYRIKVPATSANIGAGFDAMGLALNIYNVFEAEIIEDGLEFIGFKKEYENKDNIVYKAMLEVFKKVNYKFKGIRITLVEQNIPIARGLGSSSSCIVAGVLLANKISGEKLNLQEILNITTKIEGHPDNVAPAILGGFVVSVIVENGNVYYNKIDIDKKLMFLACIPEFELLTDLSRGALPETYSKHDCIFNISRAALTSSAFATKNYDLLSIACDDLIHEPYRSKLIIGYAAVKKILKENKVICSFLSGAGPTILAISDSVKSVDLRNLQSDFNNVAGLWSLINLKSDNSGAVLEER